MTEGLALLSDQAGITGLANAADFPDSALEFRQIEGTGGAVFPTLGVVVVSLEEVGFSSIRTSAREDSAILAIEPKRTFYATASRSPRQYSRDDRDAVDKLYEKATTEEVEGINKQECFADYIDFTPLLSLSGLKK